VPGLAEVEGPCGLASAVSLRTARARVWIPAARPGRSAGRWPAPVTIPGGLPLNPWAGIVYGPPMADTRSAVGPRTLAIDIGGTGLKMSVLDARGRPVNDRSRVDTPRPATPARILRALATLIAEQPLFDRVSVGFPGVVHGGVVETAPNLHPRFRGFDLAAALARATRKPVRVANDADVQGYGASRGSGVEMVLTLGTGLGSAIYTDGRLVPNLELGHHLFRNGRTYEEEVGRAAYEAVGRKRWRRRVGRMIDHLAPVFNYKVLYLGGGNAKHLHPEELPENVRIVANEAGVLGGIALWRTDAPSATPARVAPARGAGASRSRSVRRSGRTGARAARSSRRSR
jgi:polyphosphate glucokinase